MVLERTVRDRKVASSNLATPILVVLVINLTFASDMRHHLQSTQGLNGNSGNIYSFSPYVSAPGVLSLGIHRFGFGLSYGIFKNSELGLFSYFKDISELNYKGILLHAKYLLFSGITDLGIGFYSDILYLSFVWNFLVNYKLNIELGFRYPSHFIPKFCIKQYWPTYCLMLEYESDKRSINFGGRFALGKDIKLNLFIIDLVNLRKILDNFYFGIVLKFEIFRRPQT